MKNIMREESGQILVISAMSLLAIVVMAFAVIGLGNTYTTYQRMQTAADIVADSADNILPMPESDRAYLEAIMVGLLKRNNIDTDKVSVNFKYFIHNGKIYAVKIILAETINHQMGSVLKKSNSKISVESISRKSGEIDGTTIEYTFS